MLEVRNDVIVAFKSPYLLSERGIGDDIEEMLMTKLSCSRKLPISLKLLKHVSFTQR